jgi:hypothetical protein
VTEDTDAPPAHIYEGWWWVPDGVLAQDRSTDAGDEEADGDNDSGPKFPGTLTISDNGRARLRLVGGFDLRVRTEMDNGVAYSGEHRTLPVVIGADVDGKLITLVDVIETQSRYGLFHDSVRAQSLEPARVIVGVHVTDLVAPDFVAATFALENFHAWAGISGEVQHTFTPGDHSYRTVTVNQDPPLIIIAGELTFTVTNSIGDFDTKMTRVGAEISLPTRTFLRVETAEPRPYDGFDDAVTALADLVTFATGESTAITGYSIIHKTPERRRRPRFTDDRTLVREEYEQAVSASVHARWTTSPKSANAPRVRENEYLFTGFDLAIVECIPRWFTLRARAQRAIDMLLSLTYGETTFLQTEALIVAASAEAMHRALVDPNMLLMLPANFERIMDTALRNLEPEDQVMFERAVHNEPSYRHRLIDLATMPSPRAVAGLIPDIESWAGRVTTIRNGLAHSLLKYVSKHEDLDEMIELKRQTQTLLQLIVMRELGLANEVQDRVVQNAGYALAPLAAQTETEADPSQPLEPPAEEQ